MITSTNRKSLDAFIDACLDPLPDAVLVDTAHNSLVRQTRLEAWTAARSVMLLEAAKQELLFAEARYRRNVLGDAGAFRRAYATPARREAVAALILTPAPTRADVAWKKRALKDRHLPGDRSVLKAAIAADETFLDAHPTTRRRRAKSLGPSEDIRHARMTGGQRNG
ncbi:hypothetical protein [Mesorhizobium sp. A623]